MAEVTKIEWTDHTFNPWIGCSKVSAGCSHCYAETSTPSRVFGVKWGPGKERKLTSDSNWKNPIAWNKAAEKSGNRRKVFCASLADWLDDEVPIEWLSWLLTTIVDTPNLDWQLLTKRPESWAGRISLALIELRDRGQTPTVEMCVKWLNGEPPANVWIGVTVENQEMCDLRFPQLKEIPAKIRFLSMEPLLGPVTLPKSFHKEVDWLILGGESGPGARPCNVKWIEDILNQNLISDYHFDGSLIYGSSIFIKQLGSNPIGVENITDKKGSNVTEFPRRLRVREFPG